jgi:thioesterase domain-containing protein
MAEGQPVTAAELEAYLHAHIPLTAAMGVTVVSVSAESIRLAAPLAPNINHRQTVFGGSLATLAILAGWSLVYVRLRASGISARIVIQRETVEYTEPAMTYFTAFCPAPDEGAWSRFVATLSRRGRGRLTLTATVESAGIVAATFVGEYVAIAQTEPREPETGELGEASEWEPRE